MVYFSSPVSETAQRVSKGFIPLPLGNSSILPIGDEVVAIGNPFGLTGSMTTGVVNGPGRLIPIQTTRLNGSISG